MSLRCRPPQGRARRRAPLALAALSAACLVVAPLVARGGLLPGAWCGLRGSLRAAARPRPSVLARAAGGDWDRDGQQTPRDDDGDGQPSGEDDEFDAARAKPSSLDIDAVTRMVNQKMGLPSGALVPAQSDSGGELVSDVLEMDIMTARTWEKVVALVDEAEDLTVTHIAAACRRLANMVSRLDEEIVNDRKFQRFAVQAELVLAKERPDAQTAASLLWGISILRYPLPQLLGWLPQIHAAFPAVARTMSLQNLTNSLSAIAKLERSVPQPMTVLLPLVRGIADQVDSMEPPHVAATIWSLGELEVRDNEIYALTNEVLNRLSLERLREFNSKELSNLVWGMAQLNERDERLLRDVGQVIVETAPLLTMKEIAFDVPKLLCAFARLRYEDLAVIEAAAEAISQRGTLKRINNWGICALKWSWPRMNDDLRVNTRRIGNMLDAQVGKRRLTGAQIERSRMGPQEWSV